MSLRRETPMEGENTTNPLYFGVSCAFLAFHLSSGTSLPALSQFRRSRSTELTLQSRIHLLGLLLAKNQSREIELGERIRQMVLTVEELRTRRTEDAKANEKVAGIFAAHEQRWIAEKKCLQRQLQLLVSEMRFLKSRHEESMTDLKKRLEEEERAIGFKDEALEEEIKKRCESEEKLKLAEKVMDELRERANKEAQEHGTELWKHKTAFVELVSNQRRLEAELSRTVRQADVSKREFEQAVTTVDELSADVARLRKDTEQKDKVITAMLRKSKIDTADKQMLLKELKIAKARKKQAELEGDRWRKMWQSQRHGSRKGSSRGSSKYYGEVGGCSDNSTVTLSELEMEGKKKKHLGDYFEAESRREREMEIGIEERSLTCVEFGYENDKPASEEFHELQDWVRTEAEKFATILEKQHNAEIEAFTEQMRLKDERLESLKWRLLTTELEKKRIESKFDALEQNLHHYRDETMKLKSLVSNKNQELNSLKEQFSILYNNTTCESTKEIESESEKNSEITRNETSPTNVSIISTTTDNTSVNETCSDIQVMHEMEEEKEVSMDPGFGFAKNTCTEERNHNQIRRKDFPLKNDIHALGISYKIKRLKQQLLVLEKLKPLVKDAADESNGEIESEEKTEPKRSYVIAMSLLNKQVKRYQSLEEKIDNLCTRMEEINRNGRRSEEKKGKRKEETEKQEEFLEETFQLQRYMVATGQKLLEIHSKTKSSFSGRNGVDKNRGLNMAQFGQIVKSLLRDIQRGLELRIARMIGDLEGTLTSHGILHG